MAENTVEDENEATILTYDDAGPLSAEDILYLIQGAGSDRDRKLALGTLLSWIASNIESKSVLSSILFSRDHETYNNIAFLDGDGFQLENAENESETELTESLLAKLRTSFIEFARTADGQLRGTVVTADGVEFRHGSGTNNAKARILLDLVTDRLVIRAGNGVKFEGRCTPERINAGNDKSYFEISSNADINSLLSGAEAHVEKGDVVTIRNVSYTSYSITMGFLTGTGTFRINLKGYCSMPFICIDAEGASPLWSPLGNVDVSIT